MADIAIIGGTGLTSLEGLENKRREVVMTPYGEPSAPLTFGMLHGQEVVFLPRHGASHTIPPHKVNYRANIWVLKHAEVERIIAVAAVGGIRADLEPGMIALPDQIIDYTFSRGHTFFEDGLKHVTHIDFTRPYCDELRQTLIHAGHKEGFDIADGGIYGATQGPRLETAAEIDRLERDGCDMVGMTGMPESALAREMEICYAAVAVVANRAAGRGAGSISMAEIQKTIDQGMGQVRRLLGQAVSLL